MCYCANRFYYSLFLVQILTNQHLGQEISILQYLAQACHSPKHCLICQAYNPRKRQAVCETYSLTHSMLFVSLKRSVSQSIAESPTLPYLLIWRHKFSPQCHKECTLSRVKWNGPLKAGTAGTVAESGPLFPPPPTPHSTCSFSPGSLHYTAEREIFYSLTCWQSSVYPSLCVS